MKLDINTDPHGWDSEWIGNPKCDNPGELERLFINRRAEVDVLGRISDDNASYDYDDWAVCELDGAYYLLSTSGCSCPDPSETWGVQMGPLSLEEIRARLVAGEYEGYTVPGRQMADFLAVIDEAIGARS